MSRWEAGLQYLANLLVGGTGIVYAVMRYAMEPADAWTVVNHPWQPHVQHLHVLTAPLLVFACGLIWRRHVVGNLRRGTGPGRLTGPGLLLALVPMILSGYLIQTTVTAAWSRLWIVVHLASSALWVAAFAGHLLGALRTRARSWPGSIPEPRSTTPPSRSLPQGPSSAAE